MLRWMDEFSWLVASRDFPGCTLVTAAMYDSHFRQRVDNGSIFRFHILPQHLGTTRPVTASQIMPMPGR